MTVYVLEQVMPHEGGDIIRITSDLDGAKDAAAEHAAKEYPELEPLWTERRTGQWEWYPDGRECSYYAISEWQVQGRR